MLRRWCSTVRGETNSLWAIWRFVCSSSASSAIRRSRPVSASAPCFDIGYPAAYNCLRNSPPKVSVGGNATFTNNPNQLEVGDLTVGQKLTFTYNHAADDILYSTLSGHGCYQAHNSKRLTASNNRVRHGKNNCNIAGRGGRR